MSDEIRETCAALGDENLALRFENTKLRKQLEEAQKELESWRQNLTPTEEVNQRLRHQLTNTRIELEEARALPCPECGGAKNALLRRIEIGNEDRHNLEQQITSLRDELKELKRLKYNEISYLVEELNKENTELKKRITSLRAELEEVRKIVATAHMEGRKEGAEDWKSENARLRKELEEARENFDESHRLFQELSKRLEREMIERDKYKAALEKIEITSIDMPPAYNQAEAWYQRRCWDRCFEMVKIASRALNPKEPKEERKP